MLEPFLRGAHGQVVIPRRVEAECCKVKQTLDALIIEKVIKEKRIRVVSIANRKLYAQLLRDFPLAEGEAEAIALAVSSNAMVATDDRQAIQACKLLGLGFATAVGILVRMREKKLIRRKEGLLALAVLERAGRSRPESIEDARTRLEGMK